MPSRSRRSAAPETSPRPVARPANLDTGRGNAAAQDALKAEEPAGSDSTLAMAAGTVNTVALEEVAMRVTKLANRLNKGRNDVDGIPGNVREILEQCAADRITNTAQVGYILATAQHESGFGSTQWKRSEPLVEDRNPTQRARGGGLQATNHVSGGTSRGASAAALDKDYWDDAYGGRLGNRKGTSDGANFKGRGFVQLTGRVNYQKMTNKLRDDGFTYTQDGVEWGVDQPIDLVANPTHVNKNTDLAAKVMVMGTMEGDYTGKALPDYVNDEQTDLVNARRVINGDTEKNGQSIANLAKQFQSTLTGSPSWETVLAGIGR